MVTPYIWYDIISEPATFVFLFFFFKKWQKEFLLNVERNLNSNADESEYAPEQLLLFLYAAKQWLHIAYCNYVNIIANLGCDGVFCTSVRFTARRQFSLSHVQTLIQSLTRKRFIFLMMILTYSKCGRKRLCVCAWLYVCLWVVWKLYL